VNGPQEPPMAADEADNRAPMGREELPPLEGRDDEALVDADGFEQREPARSGLSLLLAQLRPVKEPTARSS
jgi:hypothetical protein